ncbi:MAG: hypothetical protein M1825_006187 [Sarcosagium campestre]|nr:MAG: hypothetical protein M1825_006187 [Sarcosagium campestre]
MYPPNPKLAIGSTTKLPPTVDSFTANRNFSTILQEVLAQHAAEDEEVRAQAQAMASSSGSGLGSGGVFFPGQSKRRRGVHGGAGGLGGDGAGGASSQGGAGGGGVGGFIHVYDSRNTPSYGRIPFPEDIFGSMEVDSRGNFVGENGNYQSNSGSYRLITKEGILGLSLFLRQKVVERLKELEKAD